MEAEIANQRPSAEAANAPMSDAPAVSAAPMTVTVAPLKPTLSPSAKRDEAAKRPEDGEEADEDGEPANNQSEHDDKTVATTAAAATPEAADEDAVEATSDNNSDNAETEKEDDDDDCELDDDDEDVTAAKKATSVSTAAAPPAEETPSASDADASRTESGGAKDTTATGSTDDTRESGDGAEAPAGPDSDAHANGEKDQGLDLDSDEDDEDDSTEHEMVDKSSDGGGGSGRGSFGSGGAASGSLPSVPLTITYPVNEMEVVTNRGGRSGSLSKFLDDADLFRRRSLTSYSDDPRSSFQQKKLTLEAFLDMAIDPILEVLDDSDSDVRVWLMQPETVEAVLKEFVKPPVFSGEPHEEYGFYKNYFICSEIIMKLYTGEEDLYESFSSDSSSGSATVNAVFGCQDGDDLDKWELLYSVFDNPAPLDEMQLLFFSKALVRLHDGFCLEDGYVTNVLRRFLPRVMPHLYSNTIKYMLTLILQSYESVHPITGRNDAMEIVVPMLAKATRLHAKEPLNQAAVENASYLLVDMLQANQADRLGAFCRREGGVYLSKYFVRDQFGTIRGFESMTHGYHNFLQFMFLEELSKWPAIVDELFENALFELQEIQSKKLNEMSGCLTVQVTTELLLLFKKHAADATASAMEDEGSQGNGSGTDGSPVGANPYSDSYPGSPRQSAMDTAMYSLGSLSRADPLWASVFNTAKATASRFCAFLNSGLPSSVEIALAKHLHALVHINHTDLDLELHKGELMQRYLHTLERRSSFDMLLIHIVPAIAYIIKDVECSRPRDNWLTLDLFDEVDAVSSLPQLIVRADEDIPTLKIYAGLLKDVIDEVLTTKSPSQNNIALQRLCKRCPPWGSPRYSRKSSGSPKSPPVSPEAEAVSAPSPALSVDAAQVDASLSTVDESSPATAAAPAASPAVEQSETQERTSTIRRLSRKSSRSSLHRTSDKASDTSAAAASSVDANGDSDADGGRKSTHYIKQMLQTPVFRGSMRLGSVIKPPEKPTTESEDDQAASSGQRNSTGGGGGAFGWNSMLKRLRKSFVSAGTGDKNEKKMLAIANEAYVPPAAQPAQAEVFVADTSKGDDVSKFVHRDGGVNVVDVPAKPSSDKPSNTITSGYMYKSKFPETGQRHMWERYYFVLNRQDGLLSYYVSESHARDRTYLRGTARPISVTEGIPVSANGQHSVYGFQINTQGHGAFMVVVDSIDTRLLWLSEIVTCVSMLTPPPPQKRLSLLVGDDASPNVANGGALSKQQLRALVVDYYKNLFGPSLRFNTPMDAPASFWMEEKIDPVAESCVLSSNLPDCVPFWGEFHGYKRLCDFWKIRDETVERSAGRVLRIVVDEDEETAVVMTSTTYRILRNSQTVSEESCDILNMSGGAIVSIHCTFDSFRIAEAFKQEGISAS